MPLSKRIPSPTGWVRALAVTMCCAFGLLPSPSHAEPVAEPPHWESWSGVSIGETYGAGYSAVVWSPWSDLWSPGLRFRLGGLAGFYLEDASGNAQSRVLTAEGEFSVGYQFVARPLFVKLYAGGVYSERHRERARPGQPEHEAELGAKLAAETWVDIADWGFAQFDAHYATAFDTYGGRLAGGYRFRFGLDLGAEASVLVQADRDMGRLGALARYRLEGADLSLAAGVDSDLNDVTGLYTTLQVGWHY